MKVFLFGGILFFAGLNAYCAEKWVVSEYQFDNRDFNTLHFMAAAPLPADFSIWGFVDFESQKNNKERDSDLTTYFHEIDIRSPRWNGVGILLEHNSSSGLSNDVGRMGVYCVPKFKLLDKINLSLFFKYFPVEFDGEGSQASFSWNLKIPQILQGRISLGGFSDWNFESGVKKDTNIVSEMQIRARLIDNLSALVEFRRNEFLGENIDGTGSGNKI